MRYRASLFMASVAACAALGVLPVAAQAAGNGQDHNFLQNQAMMHWWMPNQSPRAYPNGDPMGEVYPGRSYGIPLPGTTGAGVFAFIPGEGIVVGAANTVGAIGAGVGEGVNAAFGPPDVYAMTSRPVRMAPRVHAIHHVPRDHVARVRVIHHVPRHVARTDWGPAPVYSGGPVGAAVGLGAGIVGAAANAAGAIGAGVGEGLGATFGAPGVYATIPLGPRAPVNSGPPLPCSLHGDCWF